MKINHITEEQKEMYLKFMLKEDLDSLGWEEMLAIENHLSECNTCSEELHEKYEDICFIERWSIKLDNQLVEEDKLRTLLHISQEMAINNKIKEKLNYMINNIDTLNQYGLTLLIKTEKIGRRIFSRIDFSPENAAFEYALSSSIERGDNTEKAITNIKKVLISDRIKKRIQVELSDDETAVKITIKSNKDTILPELVLLTTDETGEIRNQSPVYNDETEAYEYYFNGLESGKYFLFVDPAILI